MSNRLVIFLVGILFSTSVLSDSFEKLLGDVLIEVVDELIQPIDEESTDNNVIDRNETSFNGDIRESAVG